MALASFRVPSESADRAPSESADELGPSVSGPPPRLRRQGHWLCSPAVLPPRGTSNATLAGSTVRPWTSFSTGRGPSHALRFRPAL